MKRPPLEVVMHTFEPSRMTAQDFFVEALTHLSQSTVPFLVGGAYGMAPYVGMHRETKDLDVFVRREHVRHTLGFFRDLGYRVELTFPHWLGKVYCGDAFIDVIFSSGNALARVDDRWFACAPEGTVLGVPVKLCPPEEMIWTKAFVQERERFDGADVLHLIHRFGETLDWTRLLERFGAHWRVLFGHVVTYGFVYPGQRHRIPAWVTDELSTRFASERPDPANLVCNGTLLSREQYLHDVREDGYEDARLTPIGRMTADELDIWTTAIRDNA